jgi:endogenous inhibitor of DNA gyrase (YacG/DUF329 family)
MTPEEKVKVLQMRQEGLKPNQIAADLGLSMNTVKSFYRRHALNSVNHEKPIDRTTGTSCKQCAKPLKQNLKSKPKKFCSDRCRREWWKANAAGSSNRKAFYQLTCSCCGKAFTSYGNNKRKYCSHRCYISDRFNGDDT